MYIYIVASAPAWTGFYAEIKIIFGTVWAYDLVTHDHDTCRSDGVTSKMRHLFSTVF